MQERSYNRPSASASNRNRDNNNYNRDQNRDGRGYNRDQNRDQNRDGRGYNRDQNRDQNRDGRGYNRDQNRDQNRDGRGYNRDYNSPNPNSYRDRGDRRPNDDRDRNSNNGYRQRQQGDVQNTPTDSPQQPPPAGERPKLDLKPRTAPLEADGGRDPNIFGIGKARDGPDPTLEKLDLSATDDQPNVDNNTTEDSQSQHKGKSPMDRRFNQDKSKDGGRGGGRGNSKGRDRKSKNSDRSNNSDEVSSCTFFDSFDSTFSCSLSTCTFNNNRPSKLKIKEPVEHLQLSKHL